MTTQAQYWSRVAKVYENEFVDPYRDDVKNPLFPALMDLAKDGAQCVADLGCGTGPLLPFLTENFPKIYAVDFASGMLQRAKEHCNHHRNVTFLRQNLTELNDLPDNLDVAIAVNSIVMPNVADQERCLSAIYRCLRPGGTLLAVLPAVDAVHYYTMLLVDLAMARGMPLEAARKNAADNAEHHYYDFAFGQFAYRGLEQHFWQPFEVKYRLKKVGFQKIQVKQLRLSWEQFAHGKDLAKYSAPWDFFVCAEKI